MTTANSRHITDPIPVAFPSADGETVLIGYLWKPQAGAEAPAVVLLHGRQGIYSSEAAGVYSAKTLSRRHRMWGEYWSDRGYVALLVDSFGPRGYVGGFPAGSYAERPPEVSEKDVRPLDAYGASAWLRSRSYVHPYRIGLQGWSNGAMTTLWAMSDAVPAKMRLGTREGFRAALAFYPGCSRLAQEAPQYRPYAPVLMLLAESDDEVSPRRCERFAENVNAGSNSGALEYHTYAGAEHNFDDPSKSGSANSAARANAKQRAEQFFGQHVREST